MRLIPYLSLIALLLHPLLSFSQLNYDEVFDGNQVRPQYEKYWSVYQNLSKSDKEAFIKKSMKDFKGDNALSPLPRVFSAEDTEILRKGVDQRARALQAFLQDYYSGEKKYLQKNVIPESIVQDAIKRSGELGLPNFSNSKGFNFWYGPDVIRDSKGVFRVVEDNLGFVGGMGDLLKARESLVKNIPGYAPLVENTANPEKFYKNMAERYKELARENKGIPLIITYKPMYSADNEDARIRKIFKEQGIESFKMNRKNYSKVRWLEMRKDGMYLHQKNASGKMIAQKVGHVVLDIEPYDIDPLYEKNYERHLFNEKATILEATGIKKSIKEELRAANNGPAIEKWLKTHAKDLFGSTGLEKNGYEGFWKLVESGKISVTNALGNEFINDKGFYPFVESLIEHYLKEEPILKNIETHSAAIYTKSGHTLNQPMLDKVIENPAEWVIKGVNGRGGDAVFIGKKISPSELKSVIERVKQNPNYFIFQKYTPLSVKDGSIVDTRVISDVSGKGVITAEVPWGREIPMNGNGKVNLSDRGLESVVISELPASQCPNLNTILKNMLH